MKDQYLLNNNIIFLNHGSFGACPKPVFNEYQQWQSLIESQPVQYFSEDLYNYLRKSREDLSTFISCDVDDIIFIPNPTTAINSIVRSLKFNSGYEILTSNHEYGAMVRAWQYFSKDKGYNLIPFNLKLPFTTKSNFLDDFWKGVTNNTKIIFISHITSPTAIIFPIKEICKRAKNEGILTIIDGAHAPGHIDLHISSFDPDIYIGACHKWLSAPKGSSFMYVKKEIQNLIDPLIISWGKEVDPSPSPFICENQYQGTRDFSPFLSVSSAIDFQKNNNWDIIKERCRKLTKQTLLSLQDILKTDLLCPVNDNWLAQMASIQLPDIDPRKIKNTLLKNYKIEIPIFQWENNNMLRFSFNAYNDEDDSNTLIDAFKDIFSK
ncbi:MAG: aminotransferase class V-fold PLP-dependent enzyme [Candidatus Marinimicrobia bacterium]|nr:aminotransferase class V-fold PLP-dependent enzyme [Candidatus Neomarinimicrobiota bacterium]